MNLDYYSGVDYYSDGDIEKDILKKVKDKVDIEKVAKEELSYPEIYHLSELRKNILNWYPFRKNASILEIGAGCGALTGLLCEKAGQVVAVELSKQRAEINYERSKEYENLEIMVGNLNDMQFAQKFDYVILNGVLEYAISFTDTERPYEDFLKNIKRYLNDSGIILVAIENKLGLKYFAGAAEDHTDAYYLGLNGYVNNNSVRTFTKSELSEILERSGFCYKRFYYPYPDYKFPSEIFTDETINSMGYGRDTYNLNKERVVLFNESYVSEELAKERVADVFSNSFLVEASGQPIKLERNIQYVKINSDRDRKFQIITTIEKDKTNQCYVTKKPIYPDGEKHIRRVIENSAWQDKEGKVVHISSLDSDVLRYSFIDCDTLDAKVYEVLKKGETEKAYDILNEFFETYWASCKKSTDYDTKEFTEIFGTKRTNKPMECVSQANIDIICDNVFVEGQQYKIIDCEWIFHLMIPKQYIIWRCLNEFFSKHTEISQRIRRNEFFLKWGITQNETDVFLDWEEKFLHGYVKVGILEKFANPKRLFSLEKAISAVGMEHYMDAGLFWKTEEKDYCEENKKFQCYKICNDSFDIVYEFEDPVEALRIRFDPVEKDFCKIKLKKVEFNDLQISCYYSNADMEEDGNEIFLNPDPQYEFLDLPVSVKKVRIVGQIEILKNNKLYCYQQKLIAKLEKRKEYLAEAYREVLAENAALKAK